MTPSAAFKAAALGFVVGAAYWPGMLSPAFVPRWGAIAIGVPLLLSIRPGAVPQGLAWLVLWVMVMAFMATLGASPDPMAGHLELFFCALLAISFFAGANLDTLDPLLTGLGASLIPSAGLVLTQYFGIWSPLPQTSSPSGLFLNSEVLAEFAALVCVWAMLRPRWWIAGVALIPVILCSSRVALLAVLVGALYAACPRGRAGRVFMGAAFILGVVAILAAFGGGKLASAEHRVTVWMATVLHWRLFGNGLGWFNASYPHEGVAHSDALQAVAEVGVAAFALLAIPVMAFRRKRGNNAERATFAAACCTILVSFPLHFPASGFLVAVLAGYLVSDRLPLYGAAHDRGSAHGLGAALEPQAGDGDPGVGRGGGAAVSVRSVHSHAAARDPRQDPHDPAAVGYPGPLASKGVA